MGYERQQTATMTIDEQDPFDDVRLDHGWTWEQLAEHCDVTANTIWRMRTGRSVGRALSRRKIEDALRWEHGSILKWLKTGEWPH